MSKSGWKLLSETPPAAVRLFARRRVKGKTIRAISLQEVAIAAGLPLVRVQEIAKQLDWNGVDIPEAERFCAGCNYDPLSPADRNRQSAYNRSCKNNHQKFAFLKKSPWWLTEFLPLIQSLKSRRVS